METTTQEQQRILEKVRKCLALSTSDNPGEAEAALRQAKKLMGKYGITESAVRLAEVNSVQTEKATSTSVRAGHLSSTVARAFACKSLYGNKGGGAFFEFIGKGPNPELAKYTYDVLWRRLEMERSAFRTQLLASSLDPVWDETAAQLAARLGRSADDWAVRLGVRENQESKKAAMDAARDATRAFCTGWIARVDKTVRSFAGQGLDPDIQKWVDKQYGKLGTRKTRTQRVDRDGYAAGMDSGAQVSLHHGVNGKAGGQNLLA